MCFKENYLHLSFINKSYFAKEYPGGDAFILLRPQGVSFVNNGRINYIQLAQKFFVI